MKPDLLRRFAQQLLRERTKLHRTVAQTDDELATLEAPQPGAPSEEAAAGQATALLSRLEEREREELAEIDAARARIATGTYGTCEECGEAIPLARLRALPASRFCLPCQLRHER